MDKEAVLDESQFFAILFATENFHELLTYAEYDNCIITGDELSILMSAGVPTATIIYCLDRCRLNINNRSMKKAAELRSEIFTYLAIRHLREGAQHTMRDILDCFTYFHPTEVIEFILDNYEKYGIDIQYNNTRKWKLIHYMCEYSPPKMMKRIIDIYVDNGWNLRHKDWNSMGIIHHVCLYSSSETVRYMIDIFMDNGWGLLEMTEKLNTPFNFICKKHDFETIKYMFDIYIRMGWDIHHQNERGCSALFLAATNKQNNTHFEKLVDLYIENGLYLDINIDLPGVEIIHMACKFFSPRTIIKIIDYYVKYGLSVFKRVRYIDGNEYDVEDILDLDMLDRDLDDVYKRLFELR